ncbi:hypothetical protein BcepSauron_036 [Burkholderia phage BcepSauron]|uniref:Uncharacterized protein n=1 Tax=Burkholderia phage BcepSauron TaxID=2530033 RepID=A0A482MLP8_9CAUD|nr:hypothetical protein H1O17_gp036 [Burkholderia phage BcepSauron]QBQ74416.1 hypothetical protein BcepSauron_036 [Burkholderia phage BcepSauron]
MELQNTRAALARILLSDRPHNARAINAFDSRIAQLCGTDSMRAVDYKEMRAELTTVYENLMEWAVRAPYLALAFPRPDELQDLYYDASNLPSVKRMHRAAVALAGRHAIARTAVHLFAEWIEVEAALKAAKARIAKRETRAATSQRAHVERTMSAPVLSEVVRAALDAQGPALVAQFEDYVSARHAQAVAKFGPLLAGIARDKAWSKFYASTLRACTNGDGSINAERLRARAADYARAVRDSVEHKVMSKAGDLKDPAFQSITGYEFLLTGRTPVGQRVVINQRIIINTSVRGEIFNQFPARIRIGGRAVSEAEYKRVQAAEVQALAFVANKAE